MVGTRGQIRLVIDWLQDLPAATPGSQRAFPVGAAAKVYWVPVEHLKAAVPTQDLFPGDVPMAELSRCQWELAVWRPLA